MMASCYAGAAAAASEIVKPNAAGPAGRGRGFAVGRGRGLGAKRESLQST
jgi:hypothetical protein